MLIEYVCVLLEGFSQVEPKVLLLRHASRWKQVQHCCWGSLIERGVAYRPPCDWPYLSAECAPARM